MTQSAPSERAQTALKTNGITSVPLMSLEREDALFVLTGDMLVYQDGGGTRRVTLRDLTRIHSDQAGLLRVETPAGTALTASLLGFDVAQVQTFFKGVRSATARAKDLPDSPTPTLGGAKTFGSAPAAAVDTQGKAQNAPAQDSRAHATTEAAVPEVAGMPEPASTPQDAASNLTAQPVTGDRPSAAAPPESQKAGRSAENPVVISSSSFSPNVSKPGLGAIGAAAKAEAVKPDTTQPGVAKPDTAKPDTARTAAPRAEASKPELRKGQTATPLSDAPVDPTAPRIELPSRSTPRSAVAVPGSSASDSSEPERQAVSDPMPTTSPVTALSKVAAATALARQAETVEALAGRLKILGAVLFVGALALAFFQFTDAQPLAGIWTLLSGGVGAIALLALGELSALLALLTRVPGPARTPSHDGEHDS